MNMFQSFLKSIPKNRSEYVNDLEIPEITLEPYVWTELDDSVSVKSDSIVPDSMDDDRATLSTDTTLPLSRAMTDSEIDYEYSQRVSIWQNHVTMPLRASTSIYIFNSFKRAIFICNLYIGKGSTPFIKFSKQVLGVII